MADSVISNSSSCAGTPYSSSSSAIFSSRSGSAQVQRREVHRDLDVPAAARHSRSWLSTSRSTRRVSEWISPVCSASGMNSLGGMHPSRRVLPAQQRLETGDLAGAQVQLRLVVHGELVLGVDRLAQVAEQQQLGRASSRRPRRSRCSCRGGPPWRRTSRRRRASSGLSRPGRARAAARARARSRRAARSPSTSNGSEKTLSMRSARIAASSRLRTVGQQDRELVAAETGDGVGLADDLLQAAARRAPGAGHRGRGRGSR